MTQPVKIIMVEDDHGHAKLIEKNIRRANINNEIKHFDDGGSALDYLFSDEILTNGPLLILLDLNLSDMNGVDIFFDRVQSVKAGKAVLKNTLRLKQIMKQDKIEITADLKAGCFGCRVTTCDLSYEYVKINGEYTT